MPDNQDYISTAPVDEALSPGSSPQQSIKNLERIIREQAKKTFPGPNYLSWLDAFHQKLAPKHYLEIGIASGGSLARIASKTHAIGIDPAFNIQHTIQAPVRLYRETSDAFFEKRDPIELFGGSIDLSFVDGLHTFDQTFRDIVNVGRSAHDKTIILVHDVAPLHEAVARRDRITNFWTGDVWKIGWMIKQLLPYTEIKTIPTYPSGLLILKGIARNDQAKNIDKKTWATLEKDVMERPFPKTGPELAEIINLKPAPADELFAWALGE